MSIDGINGMGAAQPNREPARAGGAEPGRFSRVIEIAQARRQRMTGPDQIPEEVWADMARATELAEELAARGQSLRFDVHGLDRRVVATLCDSDGQVLRHVGLGEIFGPGDPAPAA